MGKLLRCTQCDAEMTLAPLPPIEGEEHGLHLTIDGLPALRCPNGHKRFAAPAFASVLLDQLLAAPELAPLTPAAEKGFLRKRYCCPSCGAVLDTRDAGRAHFEHAMAVDGLRPVAVQVELPAYRCTSCGNECVEPRDTMASDLMQASAQAYRSVRIAPG